MFVSIMITHRDLMNTSDAICRVRNTVYNYFNIPNVVCTCGRRATIEAHDGDYSATRVGRPPLTRRKTAFWIPQTQEEPALTRSPVTLESQNEIPREHDASETFTVIEYARRPSLFDAAANATKVIGAPCESRKELTVRTGPTASAEYNNGSVSPSTVTVSPSGVVRLRQGSVKDATKTASQYVFGAPSESAKEARMIGLDTDRSDSKASVSTWMA